MRLPGTHAQSSPASDVAVRPVAIAQPRPGSPVPAAAQTAVLGAALALATGVIAAQSPYVARPTLEGVLSVVMIAAITTVACIALHRGIERRRRLILFTLLLYSATTLDTLMAPGLDVLGQIAWASLLVVAVYLLLSFPRDGSRTPAHAPSWR